MIIQNLYAALFTRIVHLGEVNPDGEACYAGYSRQQFASSDTSNLEDIVFPEAQEDYMDTDGNLIPVICAAAIDGHGVVVGVRVF